MYNRNFVTVYSVTQRRNNGAAQLSIFPVSHQISQQGRYTMMMLASKLKLVDMIMVYTMIKQGGGDALSFHVFISDKNLIKNVITL